MKATAAAPYVEFEPVELPVREFSPSCGRCDARHWPRQSCTKFTKGGRRKIITWRDGKSLLLPLSGEAEICP